MSKTFKILDKYGKPLINSNNLLKKQAFGQFSSIYEYPNYGRFRWRNYVNQDTEQGASTLTRDLVVRWSRELTSQLPWMYAAIKLIAQNAVGDEYKPQVVTTEQTNVDWWEKEALPYLESEYLTNCCVRGSSFDWNTIMFVASMMLDQDGDFGTLFGVDGRFQVIPSHRIGSQMNQRITSLDQTVMSGPFPNTIVSDGVIYNQQGKPLGYNVINPNNMVNSLLGNTDNMFFSAKNMTLTFDPRFFDRGRGFPSHASGIIQTLSLQEIESYMFECVKIQQMFAMVEKTPSGEGPDEEAAAYAAMMQDSVNVTGNNVTTGTAGMQVTDGPSFKYVTVNGGDIRPLQTDAVATETSNFLREEKGHILQSMGIPPEILLNPSGVTGRMSEGVCKTFNATIRQRQKILDKYGKLLIVKALTAAMNNNELKPNWDENLFSSIGFSHPKEYTLNDSYDRKDALELYKNRAMSLNDLTLKTTGKTATQTMESIGKELQMLYVIANQTANDINVTVGGKVVDVNTIVNEMKTKTESTTKTNDNQEEQQNEEMPK